MAASSIIGTFADIDPSSSPYVVLPETTYSALIAPDEAAIEGERRYTRGAVALNEAMLHRGPSGSPDFWLCVLALHDLSNERFLPHFIANRVQPTAWAAWQWNVTEHVRESRGTAQGTTSASAFLDEMYKEGRQRASSQGISKLIEYFLDLQRLNKVDEVETILNLANPKKLTPELLVGLLRINFPFRSNLKSWNKYLEDVEEELSERKIPDVSKILHGLRAS